MKTINKKNGEEKVDMCQALEELYNDGVEAGRKSEWKLEWRREGCMLLRIYRIY